MKKKLGQFLNQCVSSLCRGHANLLFYSSNFIGCLWRDKDLVPCESERGKSLRVIEQYILSTTEDRRVEFGVSVIKSKKLMKKMKILQTENMFMHFIDN